MTACFIDSDLNWAWQFFEYWYFTK